MTSVVPIRATDTLLDDEVAQVIEALYPRLFRYARFRLERQDAEDASAAAMERMWRVRRDYRSDRGSLETWLRAVGYNAIRDAVRRAYRRPTTVRVDDLDLAEHASDLDLTAEMADVRQAMARLSEADAEIIAHRFGLELSNEETAQLMGRTPGATATAVHRALRRLRTEMTR